MPSRAEDSFTEVLQLMVVLQHTKPRIWRRLLLPATATFWDLHCAIQSSFDWEDCHLHEFVVKAPDSNDERTIGLPVEPGPGRIGLSWEVPLADWLTPARPVALYVYDFGDNWQHRIELEQVVPREPDRDYPACIAGKRCGPPEDCGGPWGYQQLLHALAHPEDESAEDLGEWFEEDFDPAEFDPEEVEFIDAQEYLVTVKRGFAGR